MDEVAHLNKVIERLNAQIAVLTIERDYYRGLIWIANLFGKIQ